MWVPATVRQEVTTIMSEVDVQPLGLWEAQRRELEEYQFASGLRQQPPWDIPDTLAVQVALAGRFSSEEGTQHPTTLEGFIADAAAVIEAGASGIHVDYGWIVDQSGRRLDRDLSPVEAFSAVLGPLRDRFGDRFVANINVLSGNSFDECMSPARAGLCEVAPCAAGHPPAFAVPAVRALQEVGVKPEIVIHSP